jgi:2-C-methyl-D-erythritol 4-phosphate cytidylyltransferase/2-C-methyl-D-erythritol 2,4-cyclodiphosphate synthase
LKGDGADPRVAVLVTAAGSSARFGSRKKELALVEGRSILDRAVAPFLDLPGLEALVITAPPRREGELRQALCGRSLDALRERLADRFAIVPGGETRRDSVRLGLEALARALSSPAYAAARGLPGLDEVIVLVHDGARPWASPELIGAVLSSAIEHGGAVPIAPIVDTPKEIGADGTITRHLPRSSLGGAQTPQGFRLGALLEAHRKAASEGFDCTDDAELWDRYVGPVASVPGDQGNRKVTYPRDLPSEDVRSAPPVPGRIPFRVGHGWDLHRLVPGRALMLGGIEVPSEFGEDAHSDGDVLLHAIIDALLGAAALGDIGSHFPPSDERWKDADSRDLARRAAALVREAGWELGNLDCTVVLERPRLGPYRDTIRAGIAACLGVSPGAISIKAKTKEGVDAVGEGKAVEAYAVVALGQRLD